MKKNKITLLFLAFLFVFFAPALAVDAHDRVSCDSGGSCIEGSPCTDSSTGKTYQYRCERCSNVNSGEWAVWCDDSIDCNRKSAGETSYTKHDHCLHEDGGSVFDLGSCRVRADVSSDEASILAGRDRTGVAQGKKLPWSGSEIGENGLICIFSWIRWVANIIFLTITVIAVLMIAYASFLFVTATDSPQKKSRGKQALLWAIAGLVLAAVAKVIPPLVLGIMS